MNGSRLAGVGIMRKPSPEDMIYAGLVLRLGLTTEEEINNFTRSEAYKDSSFIEIILARGLISHEQHAAIQHMLRSAAASPIFQKKAASGEVAQPQVDQLAIPTIVIKPGQAMPTMTVPQFTPPPAGATAAAAPATEHSPAHAATSFDSTEMPTQVQTGPPPSVARSTTGAGIGTTGQWSTLTGTLTAEEMTKATRSREAYNDQLIGEQLGGYAILDKLGKGGMGDVYLAKQLTLNRYIALKVLPRKLARNPDFVKRFIQEAQTLARINFPSIIQVYDVGTHEDTVFFTMELVRGRTLHDMIKETGRVPLEIAINAIKQSCRALARVAREGIVHRDIKPANIMITDQGEIKVCDFGIATERLAADSITEIIGTPFYIAPEYLNGEECTSLSDQYSLGVTLHHMLGGLPGAGASQFSASVKLEKLSDLDSNVPKEIAEIVERMVEHDPAKRFGSFEDLFHALENFELRAGIITAPSEFLAERLVSMREMGWEQIKKWVAVFAMVAAGFTGLALMANKILIRAEMPQAIGMLGGVGTLMIFLAYAMILYVGLARKKVVPALGSLRTWVQTHYSIALGGYFLVMVHSGNFLMYKDVPFVAFASSLTLFLIIISGLVGRFIFQELHRQLALERFGDRKDVSDEEKQAVTRLVISTKIMGYWRVLHYPMTVFMILLVVMHVISILYYGGNFFGGR